MNAKHRQRGLNAMAEHICSTDYTDGFCSPDSNHLMSGVAHCRRHNLAHSGRDCVASALALVQAMEIRGCSIVWDHDPAITGQQRPEGSASVLDGKMLPKKGKTLQERHCDHDEISDAGERTERNTCQRSEGER